MIDASKSERRQVPETIPLIRPERRIRPVWSRCWIGILEFLNDFCSQFSTDPLNRCRWARFPARLESRSNKPKDQLARAGQSEAVLFLRSKGIRVLHQNVRFPRLGELDIIARQERTLLFIEVKTRRNDRQGRPDEAVTLAKQRRQIDLANQFISLCGLRDVSVRFDIVSVVWPENDVPRIRHVENAFRPNDFFYRS